MLRVALTGGIATGKSYVRLRMDALGIPTLDADQLAREAVAPGTSALGAIIEEFGKQVLSADGTLDRPRLGALVFADPDARRALERIVHPQVYAAIDAWFECRTERLAVADIPLLFETGHDDAFDVVVVTYCPPDVQIARIVARDGLSEAAARDRVAAQWPVAEKVRRADYVIRTDGTFAETDGRVGTVVGMYTRPKP